MTWWERVKLAWFIANMVKPIKNAAKINEIVEVIEAAVKAEKEKKPENK